ncbi:hypothetical protein ACTQ49_08475 [Luteococcus sp. Sow4_B9]
MGREAPLYEQGINVVMLYTPRDSADIVVAKQVVLASYAYATGRDTTEEA